MVFETICALLAEQLACEPERITPSTVMLEDLEMEASDLAEFMLLVEPRQYGVIRKIVKKV